jgi:hypothetical protein
VAIPNGPAGGSFYPFHDATAVNPFDFPQRVAHKSHTPRYGVSNVGTQGIRVNARNRIPKRWQRQATEGSPQQRWGRHQPAAHVIGARRQPELVIDENGRSARDTASKEEVESCAVGGRKPARSLAATREIRVVELPSENDAAMLERQPCRR